MRQAINKAVESGNEYLMVQCFEIYGDHCLSTDKPETALFYFLKSAELRRELGDNYFFSKNRQVFGALGEILYKMQEYEQAIQYMYQGVSLPASEKYPYTSSLNTMGLAYQRLCKYDSAIFWYNKSFANATANNDTIWQAIVKGNIGSLYFEQKQDDQALPLLWADYNMTVNNEINNAGNTLHRIALIYLRQGKTDSAFLLAKKSFRIVSTFKPANQWFIRNAYFTLSEIFRKKGNIDSAFYYANIYHRLNDSLHQAVARNRADVVQTRLDFEKTSNNINILLREKKVEKNMRNLLLAGILLLLIAGWFYFRWQKQWHQSRQQQLMHQKEKAETEIKNAQEQLSGFTGHIVEKNELIEKLQQQLQLQNMEINEGLLNQSILTENDWLRFKDMFDKANPGFINQLKLIAPDISTAEIRFAALTRLNLGNKHMASMLGIGTDAVRKTKSRLRQRLQLAADVELDDFIKSIS
ncbi:tetratricopeptide repeat protein [Pseudoflavitalea sp. X16]|uniref:tetratricopeptide repeat protein n=1 Tax=Paraflavitalea devenefica TaxID=2716334 RepID=UPI00141FFAFC|nr:tetratricopeptide repeat protein [Paraflavitalea devenefica]NII29322.1 tetratricopeptide repeat protein [Paraflavitalea devenefica]